MRVLGGEVEVLSKELFVFYVNKNVYLFLDGVVRVYDVQEMQMQKKVWMMLNLNENL